MILVSRADGSQRALGYTFSKTKKRLQTTHGLGSKLVTYSRGIEQPVVLRHFSPSSAMMYISTQASLANGVLMKAVMNDGTVSSRECLGLIGGSLILGHFPLSGDAIAFSTVLRANLPLRATVIHVKLGASFAVGIVSIRG